MDVITTYNTETYIKRVGVRECWIYQTYEMLVKHKEDNIPDLLLFPTCRASIT